MTSTTDTAGHPDVTEISDLTEGLLPPARSAEVRRHLDDCGLCADIHTSLEEIRGLLGTAPGPPRMPGEVARRIDAALAAESLLSATAPAGEAVPVLSSEPAEPVDAGIDRGVSRETVPPSDRPGGPPRRSTGPGRHQLGRHRRRVALGAVLTAAVLGAGSLFLQSRQSGSSDTTADSASSSTAHAFSGESVRSQVNDLLATHQGLHPSEQQEGGADGDSPAATQGAHTLLQTEVPVPDCVRQALDPGSSVLGAKPGAYAGKDAYLVVVPDAKDTTRVTAYVVDASCVRQRTASSGKVLLTQSLARP